MIQARPVATTPDLCCLPSPYRIPQGIAGLAFNFSKIEVAHHPPQRNTLRQPAKPRKPARTARA